MTTRTILILAITLLTTTGLRAEDQPTDTRINLHLTAEERVHFLGEMRGMLSSIQGVIAGIGDEDREKIAAAAKYSGGRMGRATPDSIRKKLPQAFREMGHPTHMMFEELAIRSETDDMDMLASFTGQLMQQCIACHAAFRAH